MLEKETTLALVVFFSCKDFQSLIFARQNCPANERTFKTFAIVHHSVVNQLFFFVGVKPTIKELDISMGVLKLQLFTG